MFFSLQVLAVQCDVRDEHAVNAAMSQCVEQLGLPHIVVNNAAGNFISPTERLSAKGVRTVIDIVLNGTFNVVLDVGKRLIDAKQGKLKILSCHKNHSNVILLPYTNLIHSCNLPMSLYIIFMARSLLSFAVAGASFLAITTVYTQSGSGFVVPSAAAKAGVEAMTK